MLLYFHTIEHYSATRNKEPHLNKRREAKSKGEKERYKHLNAEFRRIARRDKKAFLSVYAQQWDCWVRKEEK